METALFFPLQDVDVEIDQEVGRTFEISEGNVKKKAPV